MNKRKRSVPMLISRSLINTDTELKERMAVQCFKHNVATPDHYKIIVQMMNILLVGGDSHPSREYAVDYIERTLHPVLICMRERYNTAGKFSTTPAEQTILEEFVEYNKQFWMRQTTDLFVRCCKEVIAYEKAH